ncbi:MAG: alpha/beta hydrolase [Verrucomicrobiales bacterium]|nr:alpha/beta hydrolase [Verrucomicrobiales bacterium]
MNTRFFVTVSFGLALVLHGPGLSASEITVKLWDGPPPLAVSSDKPEAYLPIEPGADPDITRLGNVSEPELTVYQPPVERRNGTCVLICPGGGYYILAMKHEGTQVAAWLNSLGVTAAVLKYRVPSPRNEPPQTRPLLDAQRAMTLLRSHAAEWGLRPDRIGVLGFSAGGHLAAWLLCEGDRRAASYPVGTDEPSCRPDFGILIYPAYLAAPDRQRDKPVIRADLKPGPVFFVHAADDSLGPENSIEFFLDLKRAGVPGELHVYQQGGHGFGMLARGQPVHDWPARCADWLRSQGWLQR